MSRSARLHYRTQISESIQTNKLYSGDAMTFPIDLVRAQFPSLLTTDAGQARIYFDNAAGTQVPQQTIDHVVDYFQRYNSNTGVFNPT